APQSAMRPIPHQMAARSNGEPRDRAIAAGVRKMPRAIASPMTTAIAPASPICLRSCIRAQCYRVTRHEVIHRKMEGCRWTGRSEDLLPERSKVACGSGGGSRAPSINSGELDQQGKAHAEYGSNHKRAMQLLGG